MPETQEATTPPIELKEIQELALTIAAKNLNPTMLSEEFLKFSGVVPQEWELARQPSISPNFSQVTFKNGINVVAQPRSITFVEQMGNRQLDELQVSNLASQYVTKLPNAEYTNLSISPKSVVPLPGDPDGARQFITGKLLAPGPWQDFGNKPLQAGLNLVYQLENCQLNLSINQAQIQIPEQSSIPALLFAGNFNYKVEGNNHQERLGKLEVGLKAWQQDIEAFREIVNQRFLGGQQQQSLFS
ncbi:MAG: hypothetical protein AB4058_02570 [Microcystaceae cyanobacterium]